MTLNLAVAEACSFAAVAGRALVTLAQPDASAAKEVIAASIVAIRRRAVMTMRRIPDQQGFTSTAHIPGSGYEAILDACVPVVN